MLFIYLFTFTKPNIIMFVFVKVRVVQGVSDREYNANDSEENPISRSKIA